MGRERHLEAVILPAVPSRFARGGVLGHGPPHAAQRPYVQGTPNNEGYDLICIIRIRDKPAARFGFKSRAGSPRTQTAASR